MKYQVEIRKKVEDWETPGLWERVNYPEDYIEADDPRGAIWPVQDFVNEEDANWPKDYKEEWKPSDDYDWMAVPYNKDGDLDYENAYYE